MTLKYSGKSFRKVVWKTDHAVWAQLHEDAWRAFGGCCGYVVLDNLKKGILTHGGLSYIVLKAFGTPADNNNNLTRSTLRLFENSVEVGPAHVLHVDIRNLGVGRFSHWSSTNGTGEALRLSASNNSDPLCGVSGY